jgi:RimJ/RimL family protein N-acetyltransferase
MEVRPALEQDLDQILDLNEAVASEGRWIATELPFDREARRKRYAASIAADDAEMFVAVLDGRIVGTLGMNGLGRTELGMYVASDMRGRGIGRALMGAAIEWARSKGVYKITLDVWPHNEAALRLYRSFGFEEEGYLRSHYRRRSGELWDAVLMGLVLERPDGDRDRP